MYYLEYFTEECDYKKFFFFMDFSNTCSNPVEKRNVSCPNFINEIFINLEK